MGLIAKDKGGADFDPLPAGMHQAVCYSVVDLGTQPSFNPQYPPKRQVCLTWEVPSERIDIPQEDGSRKSMPRVISAFYGLTLAPKSKLRPMLESWRGRPFSADELEGFDLRTLIGVNCLLNVVHKISTDKQTGQPRTFANVASVNPLAKGMTKVKNENEAIFFSLEDQGSGRIVLPETIPEWIRKMISRSEEFIDREEVAAGRSSPTSGQAFDTTGSTEDDDVPF